MEPSKCAAPVSILFCKLARALRIRFPAHLEYLRTTKAEGLGEIAGERISKRFQASPGWAAAHLEYAIDGRKSGDAGILQNKQVSHLEYPVLLR